MHFFTRFFIVIVWMMGISASALAVTKRCAKTEKTIIRNSIHIPHETHQPAGSHEKAVSCAGSTSLFNKHNQQHVVLQSYKLLKTSTSFIVPVPLSGFTNLLYSPPRQFLNI